MKRQCFVCGAVTGVWEAGEPHLISHGACEGICTKAYETWAETNTSRMMLHEIYKRIKEEEDAR
jgi:hypothetical protein